MRRFVKFLHTLASCGLIGALAAYIIMLLYTPQATALSYAAMRQSISALCNYLLLPSLALALISGLVSMMVHRPFQETRWAWAKAVLGLSLFEATLAVIQSKAGAAAEEAARLAAGGSGPDALPAIIAHEWTTLYAVLALSLAQVGLGIWRPRLSKA